MRTPEAIDGENWRVTGEPQFPTLPQLPRGVAASILEGLDEMLTVNRLGLPAQLRRSLACTNGIENMMGTVRRICRNVKRVAKYRYGAALDRGRHDGSGKGLPTPQGPQAAAGTQSRAGCASGQARDQTET